MFRLLKQLFSITLCVLPFNFFLYLCCFIHILHEFDYFMKLNRYLHLLVSISRSYALFKFPTEKRDSQWTEDVDKRIQRALEAGHDHGFISKGVPLVIVTGWKSGSGFTNTLRLINAPGRDEMTPIMSSHFWRMGQWFFYAGFCQFLRLTLNSSI